MREQAGYREFRRGWPIVVSAFLGIGLGLSPLPFYTAGVFAPHLAAEFGWKIGDILTLLLITTLMVVWAGPLAGLLAMRWGVRRVALTSTVLFGFAFMLPALSNGSLALFYVVGRSSRSLAREPCRSPGHARSITISTRARASRSASH